MTIRFTEGFGIYGTGNVINTLLTKWESNVVGTGPRNLIDGRHAGTTDYALEISTGGEASEVLVPGIPANSVVVLGCAIKGTGLGDSWTIIELRNNSSPRISIRQTTTDGTGVVGGNGDVITLPAGSLPAVGEWAYFEIKTNTANGGTIEVRKNGVLIAGPTLHGLGAFTVDRLRVHASNSNPTNKRAVQDIYVLDSVGSAPHNDYLGDVRIETLLPNTPGVNNQWPTFVHPNKLTSNQASLETDITGWQVLQNCTIDRSTAKASHGVASLAMTATGNYPQSTTTPGVGGFPVVAGRTYAARASILVIQAVTRQCALAIRWFNSSGAFISQTDGVYSSTTQNFAPRTVSGVAPANAAFAAIAFLVDISGLETYHGDEFAFGEGSSVPFVLPSTNHFEGLIDRPHDGNNSYIESDTVGEKDTFGYDNIATVSGVVIEVRPALAFSRQTIGVRTVGGVARVGTSDYDSVDVVTPHDTVGVFRTKQVRFPINPATGQPWTIAEVNAAEFGAKIVS